MKAKTKVDKYALKQLIQIIYKKQKAFLAIIGILITAWGIFMLKISLVYLIVVGIGFVFFIFFVFLYELLVLKTETNNKIFKSLTYFIYEFNDEDFKVSTICNNELLSFSNHKYSDIYKIIENKNYIFMFITKVDAYILSKHTIRYKDLLTIKQKLIEKVKRYE